jgi:hypothetical protein
MTTELFFFFFFFNFLSFDLGNAATLQPHVLSPICPSPLGACLMQAALLFVGVF